MDTYEKKYKEALQRARELRDTALAYNANHYVKDYETIFPELRENEDERIRQAILADYKERLELETLAYKNPECNKDTVSFLEKAVAYLEKQKEQKSISFNEPYNPDDYEVVMEGNATSLKRKEQNLVPCNAQCGECPCFISGMNYQKEQKPAEWSEEDEKKIGRLRSVVNQLASYTDSLDVNGDYCEGDYAELDTWLKSLRPQSQGTYKLIVHNIYEMLKDKDFFDITPSHRVSLLNDICVRCKNADEQAEILDVPSWKPSKEQMKALGASIVFHKDDPFVEKLWELYNQLQKL